MATPPTAPSRGRALAPVLALAALTSLPGASRAQPAQRGSLWDPPAAATPRQVGADPAAQRLAEELREILRAPELNDAFAGVHVRSLKEGRTLFEHNGGKLFNPASNQKILTSAAALWYLGPNHRFRTEVRRDPVLRAGVVEGDLYVKGYGDPTLTTEELFGLVNDIALRGITKVTGNLVVDDTFFDAVYEGPGWEQEIGDPAYAAPVSAFEANFGTFTVHVLPGDQVGAPAKVLIWPPVPSIEAVVEATTRGESTRSRIWVGTSKLPGDRLRVTVRGAVELGDLEGVMVRRRVVNPTLYAGEMMLELMKLRGIEVKGKLKLAAMSRRNTVPVLTKASRPLAEVVSTLNKYSNNVVAEQILKTLGAIHCECQGTWASGNKAIRSFLLEIGATEGTFVLANGSGLNDVNRVTPELLTRILDAMHRRFEVSAEFVSSLAVAGASGTITSRFANSPAASRLRAKTGSLTGVSALSGYVATRSDDVLVFSVMMNDYPGRARAMWRIQDQIGIALARYEDGTSLAHTGEPTVARP